jgi:Na+/melibiose symporter-like transporter
VAAGWRRHNALAEGIKRMMSDADTPEAATTPAPGTTNGRRIYTCGTLRYTAAGLVTIFFWLLFGDFCWTLFNTAIPGILPLKLNQMGASDTTVSMLVRVLGTGIAMLLGPIVSFKSDRYRSRLGRRIPFLLWSTPLVGLFMILMGCYEDLTQLLVGDAQRTVFVGMTLSRTTVSLAVFAVMLVGFDIVDIYNDTLYYYLFNDVVPPKFLSRFLSLFRIAGLGASAVYNACFMEHALTHFRIMFVGGGIAYVIGFMLMCLFVKEGRYPPPPENVDKGTGFVSAVKTYAKECFTHRFYWCFFLTNALMYTSWCAGTFQALRNVGSLELSLKQLAWMGVYLSPISMALMYPAGWLADKFNPIRVYLAVTCVTFFSNVIQSVFAFTAFPPAVNLAILYGVSVFFMPFSALQAAAELPMYMRLLPRERYGQFCSANGMVRALAVMLGSALVGLLMQKAGTIRVSDYGIATHDIAIAATPTPPREPWREAAIEPVRVTYSKATVFAGSITVPGARAVRVELRDLRLEHGWDCLVADADAPGPDCWSGHFDQTVSGARRGDSLSLRLESRHSGGGGFALARVLYLGEATGRVTRSGALWLPEAERPLRGGANDAAPPPPAGAWREEVVGPWSIRYQNGWRREGSVTVPGATAVQVQFGTFRTEGGIDWLTTDAPGDEPRSGALGTCWSAIHPGPMIGLRLSSGLYGAKSSNPTPRRSGNLHNDYEVRVTRVRYLGTRTGEVVRAGELWDDGRATTFPLAGRVTDRHGVGVPGVRVEFRCTAGDGAVPPAVVTDSRGNWSRSGFVRGCRYALRASREEDADGTRWSFTAGTIGDRRYRFYPLWAVAFQALGLTVLFALYRQWRNLGSDRGYVPPQV